MNRNRFIQGLKSDIQLSEKERRRIIRRSIQKYSWKTKCTVAMEELAELQQQISKQIRGYGDRIGLLEEIADAYICLNFLESIFDIKPEDLQKAIDVKLERERRNCQKWDYQNFQKNARIARLLIGVKTSEWKHWHI